MKISMLFLLCLLFAACNFNQKESQGLFNPEKLNSQFISVHTDRDTELVLQNGTRIFLPKDALQSKSQIVKLEFKEAITMQQIVAAGLFTQSNGKALSSGGMLYVNTAKGEVATIVKPIKVKVPTLAQVKGMQLFKGEETDKRINWVTPQRINIPKDTQLELGAAIFKSNCSSCHDPLKDATGPPLYGSLERWPAEERAVNQMPYQFIRNSARVIAEGHPYANCLYEKWRKTAMTAFPNLSDNQIDAIYCYVNKEARDRLGTDTIKYLQNSLDSCLAKEERLELLKRNLIELEASRRPFLKVNPNITVSPNEASNPNPIAAANILPANNPKRYVKPEAAKGEYYNIEISTFGWFNIDIFIAEMNGVKQSELFVKLSGTYEGKMQVLLIIPSHKVMVEGGLLDDGVSFGFKETNGKLPLMQGVQAYILAIGEDQKKDQLFMGTASFITSQSQTIEVPISTTDSTQMKLRIDELYLQNVNIKITKDATKANRESFKNEIEKLEAELKDGCECLSYESLRRYRKMDSLSLEK